MKRVFLLLIIVLATSTIASAQILQGGLKGGLNLNSSNVELKGNFNDKALDAIKNNAGYHIGLMGRLNFGGLYVQGEALYNRNSYSYVIGQDEIKVKENKLSLPIVAGFKILFLRAYAGPRFDINLGDNVTKSLTNTNDIQMAFDNRWIGYQAGVGIDLMKTISIDFSYNGYFKAPNQQYTANNQKFTVKQKTRQFWISIGYYFGGGNSHKF